MAKGAISEPTEAEVRAGCRLSCQITLLGDTEIRLPDACSGEVELSGNLPVHGVAMEGSFGGAVDIGTTTIALKLYDLKNGRLLAQKGILNPQSSIAADVMGRIGAAMEGQLDRQQDMVVSAVALLLKEACMDADIRREQVDTLVVTGNTTMLYLLTGRDPACLSHAPFQADCLFGREDILMNIPVYYPACMNAFVGADITCAVLDSGMTMTQSTALLCDIGTNGELALWKDGVLYVASTAAGPAFEGAGISCGCGSIPGAIDRVWLEDGAVKVHTIGEGAASGLCGSGLLDAIAVFLETGDIDETGAVDAAVQNGVGHDRLGGAHPAQDGRGEADAEYRQQQSHGQCENERRVDSAIHALPIFCAPTVGDDHTGADEGALKEADEQMAQTAGGTDRGQRGIAAEVAYHERVCHII